MNPDPVIQELLKRKAQEDAEIMAILQGRPISSEAVEAPDKFNEQFKQILAQAFTGFKRKTPLQSTTEELQNIIAQPEPPKPQGIKGILSKAFGLAKQ